MFAKIKEKEPSIFGGSSGTFSVLGSAPNFCHNTCTALISVLSAFGVTVSGMPLMFIQTYRVQFWLIALAFLVLMVFLYLRNRCLSKKALFLNLGLVVAGTPYFQDLRFLFWIVGGGLVLAVLLLFLKEKKEYLKNHKVKILVGSLLFFLLLVNAFLFVNIKNVSATEAAGSSLGEKEKVIEDLTAYAQELRRLVGIGELASAHIHADFKMYIDDKEVNFNKPKFWHAMGGEPWAAESVATRFTHFHDGPTNRDLIHVHAQGVTLRQVFNTFNIRLTKGCIVFEDKSYCNGGKKTLKYYVNGKLNDEAPDYELQDLDKVVISYGEEGSSTIQKQLASVGENAKLH